MKRCIVLMALFSLLLAAPSALLVYAQDRLKLDAVTESNNQFAIDLYNITR